MNGPSLTTAAPAASYYAANIRRSDALSPGDTVVPLLPATASVASDDDTTYLVTDQTDKKGNRLLVQRRTGTVVIADPASVWYLW